MTAVMVRCLMTTEKIREIHRPSDRPEMEPRSNLSDLLQRLSVLTAIKEHCAAIASVIAEEQIAEERAKGGNSGN